MIISSVKSSKALASAGDKTLGGSLSRRGVSTYEYCCFPSVDRLKSTVSVSSLLLARRKIGRNTDNQLETTGSKRLCAQDRNDLHPRVLEYQKRKEEWANRYTSLKSLRDTFGSNKNRLWGDLDPASARRLYKTLLPKALLELVQAGVEP